MTPPDAILALLAAAETPPLIDPVTGSLIGVVSAAAIGGFFTLMVKRSRGPADVLAAQVAADEAARRRAETEAAALRSRELGFQEAAQFIKQSAESAIETYRNQQSELTATISVLTDSLEQHQRFTSAERDMSRAERESNEATIARLRERISSLQDQNEGLIELTRAQQLKIDMLEGRVQIEDVEPDNYRTLPAAEIQQLRDAMTPHQETLA
jgi:chromosome segregation ATPase